MKRICSMIFLMVLLVTCSSCRKGEIIEAPDTHTPCVMHAGTLYRTTGKQLPAEVDESAVLGYIQSVIHGSRLPEEEGQANFPGEGAPYAMVSDGLAVLIGNEWTLFEPVKNSDDSE